MAFIGRPRYVISSAAWVSFDAPYSPLGYSTIRRDERDRKLRISHIYTVRRQPCSRRHKVLGETWRVAWTSMLVRSKAYMVTPGKRVYRIEEDPCAFLACLNIAPSAFTLKVDFLCLPAR